MKDRLSKAGLFSIDMEKGYNKFMLKKNIRSVKLIRTERGIQMKKDVFQNCPIYQLNILVARNHESGNLEIGVPLLGNRLFCA